MTIAAGGGSILDPVNWAELLSTASGPLLMALFILALLRRWLVLPRELDNRDARVAELEAERDEYKTMVMRSIEMSERIAYTVERRQR